MLYSISEKFSTPSSKLLLVSPLLIGGLAISYYLILLPIYNVFFHPLRKFPGPKLWAASPLPWLNTYVKGRMHQVSLAFHDKYGPVVRVGPNELSFIKPEAWTAVMGHRRPGQAENGKALYYRNDQIHSIVGADRQDHTRMRRLLSHGFSTASMIEQQPLIKRYVNLLIQRLHENCDGGRTPVDVAAWFNYTTFDIIGDLSFGESFGCLENSAMHPWVGLVFANVRTTAIRKALSRLHFVNFLLPLMVSPVLIKQAANHAQLTKDKVSKRLESSETRPDFMQNMAIGKGRLSMSREEIDKNTEALTIAGSETTATTLAGAIYMIATHRAVKEKLEAEIRSSYTDEEIDLLNVAKLPYLGAVVEETLRMYPPAPNALPRVTPPQGDIILGEPVPGNVVLAVPHWAMYHSESNFKCPMDFVPDRWLGDPNFSSDRRDCMNAFSFGPRNCIGKNLAYAELRTILARTMWNFDIKLADRSSDWMNQRSFLVWEKEGLYVHLTPRA